MTVGTIALLVFSKIFFIGFLERSVASIGNEVRRFSVHFYVSFLGTHRWTDAQMDGQMDGQTDGWSVRRTDEQTDGWTDIQMDRLKDGKPLVLQEPF